MASIEYDRRIEVLMSLGRHGDAERMANEWIASSPDQSDPHAHLAWALLAKGEYKAAEEAAERACGINAEWDWPLRLLASAAFNQGDHVRAKDLQQECLRLAPWNADHHYFVARIHDSLGERELALTAARRAVELEPDHPEYLRSLYERELVFGPSDFEIFEHYYKLREVLAQNPSHTATLADLAKVHDTYFADSQGAERILRQALQIEPGNPDLQQKLKAVIRERDSWFAVMFNLLMPLFSFVLGLWVLAKDGTSSKLQFALIVLLPCTICGIPATVLFLVPAASYCLFSFSDDWFGPNATSILGRMMVRLAESKWLRRLVWTPLALSWWAFMMWLLPIPPWLTLLGIVAGIVVVRAYNIQNQTSRRRRKIRHKLFVSPVNPRGSLVEG